MEDSASYISWLEPLFADKNYYFLVDSNKIRDHLESEGFKVLMFKEGMSLPNSIISIQTSSQHFLSLKDILNDSPNARVLTIPLIAFDNSEKSTYYLLKMLAICNFKKAFEKKQELIDIIMNVGNKIVLTHDKENLLYCDFSNKVEFKYPSKLQIGKGSSRSVAEYLELNFNHLYPEIPSCYNLNGQFKFDSCLFAIHPSIDRIQKTQIELAKNLFDDVVHSKECMMYIDNNKITSFIIGGNKKLNDLKKIAGESRNSNITELAFGLNSSILGKTNWNYNSQINEGCFGMHLGIGDGKTGIHMDFIHPVNNGNKFCLEKG